jgi:hypothetical protein
MLVMIADPGTDCDGPAEVERSAVDWAKLTRRNQPSNLWCKLSWCLVQNIGQVSQAHLSH